MDEILIHPEYAKIIEEIEELKLEISELVVIKDNLIYHVCKNIWNEYIEKIGKLEYESFSAQYRALKEKRKFEIIMKKLNIFEYINMKEIDKQIEAEYENYKKDLLDMESNIKKADEYSANVELSVDKSQELQKIYKKFVQKIYVEINPNVTDSEKELFNEAQNAYEKGDYNQLKLLELKLDDLPKHMEEYIGELRELKSKKNQYKWLKKSLEDKIKKIKKTFPYNELSFLTKEKDVNKKA